LRRVNVFLSHTGTISKQIRFMQNAVKFILIRSSNSEIIMVDAYTNKTGRL